MNAPHTKPPGGGQIKFTLKFITPEMAQELLNVNFKNRRFRKVVIARYCKDLEEGLWVPTHQALGISSTGRLLDGEHRCKAIVTSGIGAWMYVAENADAHAHEDVIFSHLDQGTPRNISDISGIPPWQVSALRSIVQLVSPLYVGQISNQHMMLHWPVLREHIQALHEAAPATRLKLSAAPIRAGAIIQSIDGNRDWAYMCYRALVLLDTDDMVPSVAALMRYMMDTSKKQSNPVAMVRAYRAFDPDRSGVGSVVLSQPNRQVVLMRDKLRGLWPELYANQTTVKLPDYSPADKARILRGITQKAKQVKAGSAQK